jgi:hypothetical protein
MFRFVTVRARLGLFVTAAVTAILLVALAGAALIRWTHGGDTRLTGDVARQLQDSHAALERLVATQSALQAILRLKDADEIEQSLPHYEKARNEAAALLRHAGSATADLLARFEKLTGIGKEILDHVMIADNSAAIELYVTRFNPQLDDALQALHRYNQQVVRSAEEEIARRETRIQHLLALCGLGLAGLAALLAFTGWGAQRSITRPLARVTEQLDQAAGTLAAHSQDVTESSKNVADGATRQAAALEETSASITEILSTSEITTQNINAAAGESAAARTDSEDGESEVARLNSAMSDLAEAGRGVEKIIKSIDEIAFQTNILALNAAVEAARAGEAGAGFAVVAEEVRALAQRSAAAARETSQRIGDALAKTARGGEISAQVSRQLGGIASRTRRLDDIIKQLAVAVGEETKGIRQINTAMTQIDQVTQQNAASAETSAAASAHMAREVAELHKTVAVLRQLLGTRAAAPRAAAPARPAGPTETKVEALAGVGS